MAGQCDLCLLGLIILSSLLTGTSGVDDAHEFISSGENVRLPCNNALSDCESTTWNYNRYRQSAAVELIAGGIKKKDTESHERLSLGSDCSLNIKNVTKEDYGSYTCQQFVNGQKQGPDARVFLHVLHVSVSPSSSSSSQTEISPGRSVTLSCQLYVRFSCDDLVRSKGLQLLWVNQAGVDLKTDSRYQISSDHCIISLTTTLLNEDDNREWRCQLTHRNQLKTSVTYTVKYSEVNPVHITNSSIQAIVIPIVAASFAVLLLALILWMIRKKRADNRRGTDDTVELTDDPVTYTEVTAYSKNQDKKNKVRCDDKVTYATIRGATAGAQENCSELYASVNEIHHKPVK